MRVDFARAERAGFKAVKHARYLPHQPDHDSVILTLNRHFLRVAYLDALTDHARGWKRKGFRPGHAPVALVPESKRQEIAKWIAEQAAHYAFASISDRLESPPLIPVEGRNLMLSEWQPGQALRVRARFEIYPHVPDPMTMFDLDIPVEEDPMELAYKMMGERAETSPSVISSAVEKSRLFKPARPLDASPPTSTSPATGGGRFEQRHDPAKADVAAPGNGAAAPVP